MSTSIFASTPNAPALPGQQLPRSAPVALTSRYFGIPTAAFTQAGGTTVVYLRRRFISPADHFILLAEHTVADGERPDTLAAQILGDPEQFWRLCDANNVLVPNELTDTVSRSVRITLPEGIPAATPLVK